MRLTKKEIAYTASGADVIEIPDIEYSYKYTGKAIRKLGQLEDAEELCKKVTKQPYSRKAPDGTIFEMEERDCTALYSFEKNAIVLICYGRCCNILKINEYGKTWALTKEELL